MAETAGKCPLKNLCVRVTSRHNLYHVPVPVTHATKQAYSLIFSGYEQCEGTCFTIRTAVHTACPGKQQGQTLHYATVCLWSERRVRKVTPK